MNHQFTIKHKTLCPHSPASSSYHIMEDYDERDMFQAYIVNLKKLKALVKRLALVIGIRMLHQVDNIIV